MARKHMKSLHDKKHGINEIPPAFQDRIIPFDSLIGKNHDASIFRYFNRESTKGQEAKHIAKIKAMEAAHASLGVNSPFIKEPYTGSGSLKILYDFFDSPDLNLGRLQGTHWEFLERELRNGLDQVSPGQTLYAVFPTRSRLMRPPGFDTRKKSTWKYDEDDHKILFRWLDHCFGERAKDIVFALLYMGTAVEDRGYEIGIGMDHSGNMGGCPKQFDFSTSARRTQFRDMLEEEAIALRRSQGMNGGQIERHFKQTYKGEAAKHLRKIRRIEGWLQKAGCPAKRGRPEKESIGEY